MSFREFDDVLGTFTSRDDEEENIVNGLLDDDDLNLVHHKSTVHVSSTDDTKEDETITHPSNTGFDPSEFADPEVTNTQIQPVQQIVKYKSKMEHARAIYARELAKGHTKRAHFITLFQTEAGCTPAGASTYYATIKSS